MSKRTEQVESEIKNIISQIINAHLEFSDCLVTITKVQISPDLKNAYILIDVLPENKTGSALKKIRNKKKYIQKLLKTKIRFYTVPQLNFIMDEANKKRREIEEKLKEVKKEDAQLRNTKDQ